MQNLISHGADVEARNAVEGTPLISAASAGNVDVLRILLDHGESVESHQTRSEKRSRVGAVVVECPRRGILGVAV